MEFIVKVRSLIKYNILNVKYRVSQNFVVNDVGDNIYKFINVRVIKENFQRVGRVVVFFVYNRYCVKRS